jgi:hypothetical protein
VRTAWRLSGVCLPDATPAAWSMLAPAGWSWRLIAFLAVAMALLPILYAGEVQADSVDFTADIQEIKMLLAHAKRDRVRQLLESEIASLEKASHAYIAGTSAGHNQLESQCQGTGEDDPLPHVDEVEEWDEDVRLVPPQAKPDRTASAGTKAERQDAGTVAGRAGEDTSSRFKQYVDTRKQQKRGGKRSEGRDKATQRFVGDPLQWTEVWSPKVKVTLLPYGVAECSHVAGQLETCNLEVPDSPRTLSMPICHLDAEHLFNWGHIFALARYAFTTESGHCSVHLTLFSPLDAAHRKTV